MLEFGKFKGVCEIAPLPLCKLVESKYDSGPACYARSVDTFSQVLFQPATLTIHIISLIMTVFMIIHVKTKYIALGRKEFVQFFYLYMLETIFEFVIISGLIRTTYIAYKYLVAIYYGFVSATIFCLFFNGFVGYQLIEDGTKLSVWSIRLGSSLAFAVSFLISIATFENFLLSTNNPVVLWSWIYIVNGTILLLYTISQIVLVWKTCDDYWPIGNIILGFTFFILGQVILNILSSQLCSFSSHYLDGMFPSTVLTLLAVMMIYKYWDSLTKEDIEFTVSKDPHQWEVKDLLMEPEQQFPLNFNNTYGRSSHYHRTSKPM
ncbi:chitin synthase export chaperone [Neoconidiobolus thromboides FSU 785]|nr:chitin synthase export chaperone [Neoconidiobolus thromboides FSU 785]